MNAPDASPTIEDIRAAAERIGGEAVRTPLLRSALLDELTGARIFLKAENLQRTGSFKFRGAFNALAAQREAAAKGVVACSSGNHAQGVAEAARIVDVSATIVMPRDAPEAKKARTRRAGATIVEYDRETEDREAIAHELAAREGALFVHPYEDFHVMAGQGTCGLEIAEDLAAMDLAPSGVLVCTGGGGLLGGIAVAVLDAFADVQIIAAEPEGFDDYGRSLRSGERETNARQGGSVCDAILTPAPGRRSFAITRNVAWGTTVTDAEALEAVAFAADELKTVVEPGGAVALATLLKEGRAGNLRTSGTPAVFVATLSGGNIDPAMLARALSARPAIG